jgi:predicted TIM-barrel fold metal-dependent hydrolase
MSRIPIFDSNAHPTLTGGWINSVEKKNFSFEALAEEMDGADVKWALAVGLGGIGQYSEELYAAAARRYKNVYPIAFLDVGVFKTDKDIQLALQRISDLGYLGIKIHPRLSSVTLDDSRILKAVIAANERGLVVMLCTYFYGKIGSESVYESWRNNETNLKRIVDHLPSASRLILVHGGGTRFLDTLEIARGHQGILLDLSFTLSKFEGSSIDMDLRFAATRFDRRICVGSDSPEFSLIQLRRRFDWLTEGLPDDKKQNIGFQNISRFLRLSE